MGDNMATKNVILQVKNSNDAYTRVDAVVKIKGLRNADNSNWYGSSELFGEYSATLSANAWVLSDGYYKQNITLAYHPNHFFKVICVPTSREMVSEWSKINYAQTISDNTGVIQFVSKTAPTMDLSLKIFWTNNVSNE